jgi:hypothetical protein
MRGGDRATVEAFEQAVAAIPHVREAQRHFMSPATFCVSSSPTCPPSQEV